MNSEAAKVLGTPRDSEDLSPGLRELLDEGVVHQGGVVTFARHADEVANAAADTAPGRFANLTLWECSVSSFHLDDVVPVKVASSDDGEPLISEEDQVLMLRYGLRFARELIRLIAQLDAPVVPVRCIVAANSTNGTFRFHRVRPGESWLAADLDSYTREKIIVVDGGPSMSQC